MRTDWRVIPKISTTRTPEPNISLKNYLHFSWNPCPLSLSVTFTFRVQGALNRFTGGCSVGSPHLPGPLLPGQAESQESIPLSVTAVIKAKQDFVGTIRIPVWVLTGDTFPLTCSLVHSWTCIMRYKGPPYLRKKTKGCLRLTRSP